MQTSTLNTTHPHTINWRTSTVTNDDELASLHIGHVTVGTVTADVELFHDQKWFVNGRAEGRPEHFLNGADITSSPDFTMVGFHVEHQDVAAGRYLATAPAALAYFRPNALPDLPWMVRPTSDEHTAYEAEIATVVNTITGMTTTVSALFHPGLLDLLQSDPTDMSMHNTDGAKRHLHLPVVSKDATLQELTERLRAAPQDVG